MIHTGGGYQHDHQQNEEGGGQRSGVFLERLAEYVQRRRVSGQLQHPKQPEHAQEAHVQATGAEQHQVEGQDRQQVDQRGPRAYVTGAVVPVRHAIRGSFYAAPEPKQVLHAEHADGERFEVEELCPVKAVHGRYRLENDRRGRKQDQTDQ